MLALGFGSTALPVLRPRTGAAPAPAVPDYALPNAVDVRFEPNQTGGAPTVDGSGRVTLLPDLKGLADATPISGVTAPKLVTDALGRKGLLFEGAHALEIADTLANYSANACTVYALIKYLAPVSSANETAFSLGRNPNTPPDGLRGFLNRNGQYVVNGVAANEYPPFPALGSKYVANAAGLYGTERAAGVSRRKMICHYGLQAVAVTSGAGNTSEIHHNDEYVTGIATIHSSGTTTTSGAEIGRWAFTPAGSYANMILYGLWVVRAKHTSAQIQANIAAAMTAYGIAPVTSQLILEGDSRFGNTGPNLGGDSLTTYSGPAAAAALEAAGVSGWRVINHAFSGSYIDRDTGATGSNLDKGLRQRRDYGASATSAIFSGSWDLPGRNVVAVECAYNDSSQTGSPVYTQTIDSDARGAEIYANLQNLVHGDARGYLKLGYEYIASITMPGPAVKEPVIERMRANFRSASFFADFNAAPGNTYAGKVRRAEVPLAMPVAGAWGTQVLGPTLAGSDARITGSPQYWYDVGHPRGVCTPYIMGAIVTRMLGADPYT